MGRFQFLIFPLWAWMWHEDRERPKVWVCGPMWAQSLAAHSGPVKAPSFLGQVTASSACLSNWAEDPFFFCSFCLRRKSHSSKCFQNKSRIFTTRCNWTILHAADLEHRSLPWGYEQARSAFSPIDMLPTRPILCPILQVTTETSESQCPARIWACCEQRPFKPIYLSHKMLQEQPSTNNDMWVI